MRVLVAVASKHGSTSEVAQRIGAVLEDHGIDVRVSSADHAVPLAGYDAVVLGSAVYAGHWMKEARTLADRLESADPVPMVWLFSIGPVGDPPKPEQDPVDVAEIVDALAVREHRVFAGKLDRSELSFGERAIVRAFRVAEGDFRDWEAITAWANGIAATLRAEARAEP